MAKRRFKDVQEYPTLAGFPNAATLGVRSTLYIDASTGDLYRFDGTIYVLLSAGVDVFAYANRAAFPATGVEPKLYIDKALGNIYYWNATTSTYIPIGSNSFTFNITGDGTTTNFTSSAHTFTGLTPKGLLALVQESANVWAAAEVPGISFDTTANTIFVEFVIAPPLAEVWKIIAQF